MPPVLGARLAPLLPLGALPVHVGFGPVPAGHRVVEAWRVLPGPARPRFLLPLDAPAARRVLTAHPGLRETPTRLRRRAAAVAFAPLGALQRERAVLRVSVPAGVGDALVDELFVTRHLRHRVPGAVATALSLRPDDPRAKPTVQLVAADGRVVAFAKVAPDGATAARVRREAELLERFGRALPPDSPLRLPRVIAAGTAGGTAYSIVQPLPDGVRGGRNGDGRRALDGLMALRDAVGVRSAPLAATRLWRDATAAVDEAVADPAARAEEVTTLARAAGGLTAFVRDRDGEVELPVGPFHGDWVPWNLGWAGRTLWAWDLEYGSEEAPVGLDALRWVFQVEHVARRRGLAAALEAMAAAGPELLPRLGVDPAVTPVLVRLHLVELLGSALALAAAGRGLPAGLDGAGDVVRQVTR